MARIVTIAFVIFFVRAAQFENRSGLVWGLAGVAVSFASAYTLSWGVGSIILGQLLLFFGFGVWLNTGRRRRRA